MLQQILCDSNAIIYNYKLPLHFPSSSSGASPPLEMGFKLSKQGTCIGVGPRHVFSSKAKKKMTTSVHSQGAKEGIIMLEEEEQSHVLEARTTLKCFPGQAFPLGVSKVDNGINFAIFSHHATSVTLCLSIPQSSVAGLFIDEKPPKMNNGMVELCLDAHVNKTGDIWHLYVENLPRSNILYSYQVDGPHGWHQGHRFDKNIMLLDPYAKLVEGRRIFGDASHKLSIFFGTYDFDSPPFDWGDNYKPPKIEEKDLIVYEMNVRAFTADKSSGLDPQIRGSFLGVIEKIPHLLELGVNALELLPVFEFDEFEFQRRPNPRDHMINTWGYSTINFFAPMSRYASNGRGPKNASLEFKRMVKALHNAGIEVILDVVYNHTNEADDEYPYTTSFRGIDNKVYYMVDPNNKAQLLNFSGCGNTLNCNHPVVMELILDSLRHWVIEYHVDGFRFDLASVLCRDSDGSPLNAPPLIRISNEEGKLYFRGLRTVENVKETESRIGLYDLANAIAKDATLSTCKIIAEPWDCVGLYLVGRFPNWDRWAEWNGKYRDDLRRFIKGDAGMKGAFATRVAGSADLYKVNNRRPYHSVNFVIAHDGFTLRDLVSYDYKHNDANGEGGNDGSNDNFSWNCGFEGESNDPNIKALRSRQMKNFHLALMISQGVPMMLMGDEYAHTRNGNNNSYGHDTSINHFQWGLLTLQKDSHFRFFSEVIKYRRTHHIFSHENFLSEKEITWHEKHWDNYESKFLAFTLHEKSGGDVYLAFNAHEYFVEVSIPPPPSSNRWFRVVDTNLESPDDIVSDGVPGIGSTYKVAPYSSLLLEAKP